MLHITKNRARGSGPIFPISRYVSNTTGEMDRRMYRRQHHIIKRNSNNYIIDALKLLKDEGIHICDHEIKNENIHHGIIGGNIEIREILSDKEYAGARESCRKRELLFLEQLLEEDNRRLLKWKHLCMEQGRNIKGKIPKWFKILEKKVMIEGSRIIKEKYINKNLFRTSTNMLLFDEDESKKKSDKIITWNMEEELIFCIDKKKSKSKEYKRIGIHIIMKDIDLENSPTLEKCKGCEKNVARKNKNKEECMIYINANNSRIIKKRDENGMIKPYETLRNINNRNEYLLKKEKDEAKDRKFNAKIEIIDKLVNGSEEDITKLKKEIDETKDE